MAISIRFSTFPQTQRPPSFAQDVIDVFEARIGDIGTTQRDKGLTSDQALAALRPSLIDLGFTVEGGKRADDKVKRPVFFGENARPELQYEVDAWHEGWRAGLEVEAGRALMGNAVYRDLIQALVMVDMEHLFLAVPLGYRYKAKEKEMVSADYERTISIARALYGHSRIMMPFTLCVIGY